MNLNEEILRIREMMGLNEEENTLPPYGVIIFDNNKILVGDDHETPLELSDDLTNKIVKIANQYGYWGEGTGIGQNNAIIKSNFYNKLHPKMYKGSWDEDAMNNVSDDIKINFLYALFSNPIENKRIEKLTKQAKPNETIIDLLSRTIPSWSADMGKFNLEKKDVEEFLKNVSEKNINFYEMSHQVATAENIKTFITKGSELQWPETPENPNLWKSYPYKMGKFARKATTYRDEYLINAGSGIYFVGCGHLLDIKDMVGDKIEILGGEEC